MSDKQLTQESGFFSYLEPGDVVLAGRSFTIVADVAVHGAKLEITAFTREKLSSQNNCPWYTSMW